MVDHLQSGLDLLPDDVMEGMLQLASVFHAEQRGY